MAFIDLIMQGLIMQVNAMRPFLDSSLVLPTMIRETVALVSKAAKVAHTFFVIPVLVGCSGGVLTSISRSKKPFETVRDFLQVIPRLFNTLVWNDTNVGYPIGEEIFFRGILQGSLKNSLLQELSKFSLVLSPGCINKVAATVAIVATAVLFGFAHQVICGYSIKDVWLSCGSGIVYGLLREKFGLVSSITAHMLNNGLLDVNNALIREKAIAKAKQVLERIEAQIQNLALCHP
ncbi:MAG: hypothetical protein JWO53_1390 [Chlamydiia bacterium]|nr:hypothetical protein [Chlamydiia bacterium]